MKLVICRHGMAVQREDFLRVKKDDSLRPLVAKGKDRARMTGRFLKNWGYDFDMVVTSPYLRARQTAEILADVLKVSNLFESPELVPQAPPPAFAQWLQIHADECLAVLVVGHEPQLSSFATWCLSGQKESFIDLKKSGLISLEVESFSQIHPGSAILEYVLSPKLVEKT
jgi:phosphohistidine phosphatase